jgi:general stress protein 26
MAEQHKIDRVWDIIEKVGVGMLTTRFDGGLRARPLEARPEREAGLIWFVTDLRSGKEHEIEVEHDVGLVFIDHKEKAYLSLTARAEVRRDHAKAREIWKKTDSVWWKGANDPNVCVLRVQPLTAELWDGPASKAVAAFEFAKARLTGKKPNLGENRKVTVRMAEERPAGPVPKTDRRSASARTKRAPMPAEPGRRPSDKYRLIWEAMHAREQITFIYRGVYREACPIILGYSKDGDESVFAYQIGGSTTSKRKLPGWGCFNLAEVRMLERRPGEWREGTSHTQTQNYIKCVDVDVNIADTLKWPEPLRFGDPRLLPPRGRKAA